MMDTLEEAFVEGAKAMQSKIAAYFVAKGDFANGTKILTMSLPPYSEPEMMEIR